MTGYSAFFQPWKSSGRKTLGIETKPEICPCGTKWLNSPKIVKMMLCRHYLVAGAVSGDSEARSMSSKDL